MAETTSRLGALWVNKPKSEKGPVLTGEINGQRVVAFKNKKWDEKDGEKQPMYHILAALKKGEVKKS